jgi:hypothetical protein
MYFLFVLTCKHVSHGTVRLVAQSHHYFMNMRNTVFLTRSQPALHEIRSTKTTTRCNTISLVI